MLDLSGMEIVKDEASRKFLKVAYDYAWNHSDDVHTKTAAIIVRDGKIISRGVNHMPPGMKKLDERIERPLKYKYVTHAERVSVYSAAKNGVKTEGATMYAPWYACPDCAMAIIEGGIKEVIGHRDMMEKTTDRWQETIGVALGMLREAGVKMILFDGEIGGTKALFDGEEWKP